MEYRPHTYQTRARKFIEDTPYCALFLDMGLGKTVTTLTALRDLIDAMDVERVLVIAPKSVAENTWTNECDKWDHLKDLRLSVVMGDARKRRAALDTAADVYVTNRDNVIWLVEQYTQGSASWPFDCVVIDESSSFKNFQSKRYKALMKVRAHMHRVILLTGTPAPNGLEDLWAQIKILDKGERLGKYITHYRDTYFTPGSRNGSVIYEYRPRPGAREKITSKISDICLSMSAADYLELPQLIECPTVLRLPDMNTYRTFERNAVLDLPDGDIEAVTAVSLTNKLLQFASGAIYDEHHIWHEVHTTKIQALTDILESTAEPVLIYYNYTHELDRITAAVPDVVQFRGEPDLLTAWNSGQIRVMAAHPASVAYGLNMQQGGHIIVWFSPTWNLELYQQANARLHRQGQTKPVLLYHLICKDTMDEVVSAALRSKDQAQTYIMQHLKNLKNNEND